MLPRHILGCIGVMADKVLSVSRVLWLSCRTEPLSVLLVTVICCVYRDSDAASMGVLYGLLETCSYLLCCVHCCWDICTMFNLNMA